jgi:hypothetical protein
VLEIFAILGGLDLVIVELDIVIVGLDLTIPNFNQPMVTDLCFCFWESSRRKATASEASAFVHKLIWSAPHS